MNMRLPLSLFLDERGVPLPAFANIFKGILYCREEGSKDVYFIVKESFFSLESMLSFEVSQLPSCCLALLATTPLLPSFNPARENAIGTRGLKSVEVL